MTDFSSLTSETIVINGTQYNKVTAIINLVAYYIIYYCNAYTNTITFKTPLYNVETYLLELQHNYYYKKKSFLKTDRK
jgi:hypothetical protein